MVEKPNREVMIHNTHGFEIRKEMAFIFEILHKKYKKMMETEVLGVKPASIKIRNTITKMEIKEMSGLNDQTGSSRVVINYQPIF